mmetsp:Transcript_16925/g.39036  ORF Transcript_16925/g.39036 Transcript_16925/m.39036 type:complete len:1037 (+) Transcript_16925:138-3248(+)|eukprot:CAMPEP_0116838182 /NCGR_PEP_ID=MMETSP0418-20121206/9069_1 /TAXON_ID=1158023 /ORGANISM="Astrosyne radiata, Strain 13vi08-1A" /LENGTH=1036 /DNA_ID=CAMNT_0004468153 /DNA_START=99 /DNA_END=3209 /DNA_ORIENTATION=-
MTPNDLERLVQTASNVSSPQAQWEATNALNQWVLSSSQDVGQRRLVAHSLIHVLQQQPNATTTTSVETLFFALTTLQRLELEMDERVQIRSALMHNASFCAQAFLETKVGVVLARMIQTDYPHAWPTAFEELHTVVSPIRFLRTLEALLQDFDSTLFLHDDNDDSTTNNITSLRDTMRGFTPKTEDNGNNNHNNNNNNTNHSATTSSGQVTAVAKIMEALVNLLESSGSSQQPQQPQQDANNTNNKEGRHALILLTLQVLRGLCSWVDLALVVQERLWWRLFSYQGDAALGAVAMECFQQMVGRGMEGKASLLYRTQLLTKIQQTVNLETLDASPTEVVIEVAKLVNTIGLELWESWDDDDDDAQEAMQSPITNPLRFAPLQPHEKQQQKEQVLEMFFHCFAYDDIDVSGAVIPLAKTIAETLYDSNQEKDNNNDPRDALLSQLLTILYRQMRYPQDFTFTFETDIEAEEEMYRTDLNKLHQRLVRAAPNTCLQFLGHVFMQLPVPLPPARDLEAALRLLYHYGEGIRPPPGLKTVMKKEAFVALLVALLQQQQNLLHPEAHFQVVLWYLDVAVRYSTIFQPHPELLPPLLEYITSSGLQHPHGKVRSRSCYLLLRLIKSLVGGQESMLRPIVEPAVRGIQTLLMDQYPPRTSQQARQLLPIVPDDALYLLETTGILLGKTGLSPQDQQSSFQSVMAPHVQCIQNGVVLLGGSPNQLYDNDDVGIRLAASIAAMIHITKGFFGGKCPLQEGSPIRPLLAQALVCTLEALKKAHAVDGVRRNSAVLFQRMIPCLGVGVLTHAEAFLTLLIRHAQTLEDLQDVAQLWNQLCIKFQAKAVPALTVALWPFLEKCHGLMPTVVETPTPSHVETEQWAIQKWVYLVLQHTVSYKATDILLAPVNASRIQVLLETMGAGAMGSGGASEQQQQQQLAGAQKTCLIFFRELMQQWGKDHQPNNGENNGGSTPQNVFLWYTHEQLIPGMMQKWIPTAKASDAMTTRVVSEFAQLLWITKGQNALVSSPPTCAKDLEKRLSLLMKR